MWIKSVLAQSCLWLMGRGFDFPSTKRAMSTLMSAGVVDSMTFWGQTLTKRSLQLLTPVPTPYRPHYHLQPLSPIIGLRP